MKIKQLSVMVTALCLCMMLTQAGATVEYRFFIGMTDGSEQSPDGVEYIVKVEVGGDAVDAFQEAWHEQSWTDEKVVDLTAWAGHDITLVTIASPGPERNTGWDWIAIGEPRIVLDGQTAIDLLAIGGDAKISMLIDGETDEREGLDFGATFDSGDRTAGGETKPSFFQHPAWNGEVGDTIARFDLQLPGEPTPVQPRGKLASTWAEIKSRR